MKLEDLAGEHIRLIETNIEQVQKELEAHANEANRLAGIKANLEAEKVRWTDALTEVV